MYGKEIKRIFEAENFELNYRCAVRCRNFVTFIFVSKNIIVEDFLISSTKFIAGTPLFREFIASIDSPLTHVSTTNGSPWVVASLEVLLTDIIENSFPKEKIEEATPEKIERLNKLKYK